jgi:type II restriction/modification system DNA methylase subunit YeeA
MLILQKFISEAVSSQKFRSNMNLILNRYVDMDIWNFLDEIKIRLNTGNDVCYHSVQNLLSSRLI